MIRKLFDLVCGVALLGVALVAIALFVILLAVGMGHDVSVLWR